MSKIYFGERGSGKTAKLIEEAGNLLKEGKYLIVLSDTLIRAEDLARKIIEKFDNVSSKIGAMSMYYYIKYFRDDKDENCVLIIDDIECMLRDYIKKPYIATMSIKNGVDMEEVKKEKPLGNIEDSYENFLYSNNLKEDDYINILRDLLETNDEYEDYDDYENDYNDEECPCGEDIISSILINEEKKTVTVVFSDGDVQMSKCHGNDEFDGKVGVSLCMLYHMFGSNTQASKYIKGKARVIKKKEKQPSKNTKRNIKVDKNEGN